MGGPTEHVLAHDMTRQLRAPQPLTTPDHARASPSTPAVVGSAAAPKALSAAARLPPPANTEAVRCIPVAVSLAFMRVAMRQRAFAVRAAPLNAASIGVSNMWFE